MKEHVRLELSLDKDVVEWIDILKKQLGFRNRDVIVNRLLREIRGEEAEADPEITT